MKKNTIFYLTILSIFISCKKFVEIPPPKNQLLNEAVFADSANATAALLGIYISMVPDFALQVTNGGLSVITGLSGDELQRNTSNVDEDEFFSNNIKITNYTNGLLWIRSYNYIFKLNSCIEGISKSNTINSHVKNQLLSEAAFAKAFVYFNIINLYGAVPFIYSTDYTINRVASRTSIDSLYNQILKDLDFAKKNLSDNYITEGRFRPNKQAVNALLSKILLYKQQWENAEKIASEIINSGIYQLENDINNVFLINSKETIWKLQVNYPTTETWNGYYFNTTASAASRPTYQLTTDFLNAFENGDKRNIDGNWIKRKTVTNIAYTYPYKYKIRNVGTARKEEFVIFRLAEIYLIRAEARAEQNNLAGALNDLNIIRARAGLNLLPASLQKDQVLNAIRQERRIELFCEFGNRWYDLKRWNLADAALAPIKPGWQSTDVLYPIPKDELDKNPFLIQNPGY